MRHVQDVTAGRGLSDGERRRYARQLLLPGVGESGQERLRAARVLVIGAGGLGSVTATYLAAAGVGTLGIIDDDLVEESNLHRQVIHDSANLGMPKVESARRRLEQVNPLVEVITHRERLDEHNAVDLIGGYDLVVDGADNFATRYVVADAAALTGRPHVWGSILRFDGQVSVWWPPHGPCYRCVFDAPPPPGSVASCAEAGVFGSLCAAVGSMQSSEAIKIILGIGAPLIGRLMVHDVLAGTWATVTVRPNPACRLCGAQASITAPSPPQDAVPSTPRVTAQELAALLTEQPDLLLVDVREPHEWEEGIIAGALLLPLGEIESLAPPPGRRVVLYCAGGTRSAAGVARLRAVGVEAVEDLEGGIGAWRKSYSVAARR